MLKKSLVCIFALALLAGCSKSKDSSGPPPPAAETLGTWRDSQNTFMKNFALTTTDDCNGFAVNDKGVAVYIYRVDEDGKMYQLESVKNSEVVYTEIGKVQGTDLIPTPEFTISFIGFNPDEVFTNTSDPTAKDDKTTATTTFALAVNGQGQMTMTPTVTYVAGKNKKATVPLPGRTLDGVSPEASEVLVSKATSCSALKAK